MQPKNNTIDAAFGYEKIGDPDNHARTVSQSELAAQLELRTASTAVNHGNNSLHFCHVYLIIFFTLGI